MKYKVTAINTATLRVQKAAITSGSGFGREIDIPVFTAAVEGNGFKMLIDTGVRNHDLWNARIHPVWRSETEELERGLAEIGWKTSDIDFVINSHLHYDHAENNILFPNAQFVVQRREWEYAHNPVPSQKILYDFEWTSEEIGYMNYTLIAPDEYDFMPGLRLIQTPGHTPGHQSILLNTDEGVLCVAGDAACLFECFRGPVAPGGTSIEQGFDSLEKIRRTADRVLMAHDPNLLQFQSNNFPLIPEVGGQPFPGEIESLAELQER